MLTLRQPQSSAALVLRLIWVTCLVISMDFGQYAGSPLIFRSSLEPLTQNRWALEIQFGAAPEGRLSCECNDIALKESAIDDGLR